MNAATLPETNLVFSRVGIDINAARVKFQKQDIGRVPAMIKHILVSLTYRVTHQLVAHHAAINVKILHIGLAARKRRPGNPAPQPQTIDGIVDKNGVLDKRWPADTGNALLLMQPVIGFA